MLMITTVTMITRSMNNYLSSINKTSDSLIIKEILNQANELKTPIISQEGINLLIQLIKISKTKKVLEIGTAIGYSAIMMALNTYCFVTTIEKDEENYKIAKENINKAKLESKIELIFGDALAVDLADNYDLIFIDAAKAQYFKFLERFKKNLNPQGLVVCDNLLFHGLVEKPETLESKRIKSLVKKISDFNSNLLNHPEFETYIYEIGDGLSISIKK